METATPNKFILDVNSLKYGNCDPNVEQVNDAPGGAVARPPQSQYYE